MSSNTTPGPAALFPSQVVRALLACAAPLISLGILLASPSVSLAGGLAFLAGAASFSFALGYSWLPVFLRRRRPPPSAEPR
ncbi:MAG: hypothetical protein A2Z07_12775 [Armatimonadetes bacterium RBG_16_67_12]|nr:MAG: hypothetical protein A2Z07_12775 [Armatimonadetes bacterium RBG_16_67_12]